MPSFSYQQLQISDTRAAQIAFELFKIEGTATPLTGEIDFNFKIKTPTQSYILKISRPDADENELRFQDAILHHLQQHNPPFRYPTAYRDEKGCGIFDYTDTNGLRRKVRLLDWIEGRLYADVSPKTKTLHISLGKCCGQVCSVLQDFEHLWPRPNFEWDLNNALWTEAHLSLFSPDERALVEKFIQRFKAIQPLYQSLRKGTIHNDANERNILVDNNFENPTVSSLIDYGDAVYSQIINDVSVALAYALMDTTQPLSVAKSVVAGYHRAFPLLDDELRVLYITTAMRLVISVTKSAINKRKEPENTYLLISEQSAWQLLRQWTQIDESYAYYTFRSTCDLAPCPQHESFLRYAQQHRWQLTDLIPSSKQATLVPLDLSVGSTLVGNYSDYLESEQLNERLSQMTSPWSATLAPAPPLILVGGYGEVRPFYSTDAFEIATNEGHEYRTIHLGVDFWAPAHTAIHTVADATVISCADNAHPKDYGPTLILQHTVNGFTFFTLYGHLTRESLVGKTLGQVIKKGEKIGEMGTFAENGNWAPHLHFQVILDLLGHQNDFVGVASPSQWPVFQSLCPDPNLLFQEVVLCPPLPKDTETQLAYRREHLGKSLSLSYKQPLTIARGQGAYLIDHWGQKYLDTVNNVAHVGHEHPAVVKAGQAQMAVLNTNTRYLNDEMLSFAEALLETLPPELSVVHFVNSGSEANELALRMARTMTGQKDIIALELGYHGNTQGCIDVSSYKFNGKGGKGCPAHTHLVPLPDSFRGIYRGSNTGVRYAQHVQQQIDHIQSEGRLIAAFLAESIVSCGGQIDLPRGFLSAAYAAVRAAGGVCIADEVQTGFGRVGKAFWGFELHGVVPDIVTMGKPIGNGHPLAAVVCTRAIADAFANGMEYFNTFGGNPVSCAIGKKVLEIIHTEKLQQNAYEVGEYLKTAFWTLHKEFPILGDVRGEGLFLGIELVDGDLNPLTSQTAYLANRMKDHHILMSVDGPYNNVLKIKPPLCFSRQNAEELLTVMHKVLQEDAMRL